MFKNVFVLKSYFNKKTYNLIVLFFSFFLHLFRYSNVSQYHNCLSVSVFFYLCYCLTCKDMLVCLFFLLTLCKRVLSSMLCNFCFCCVFFFIFGFVDFLWFVVSTFCLDDVRTTPFSVFSRDLFIRRFQCYAGAS